MTPTIVVVGSANMDLVVRTPRIPAPGETLQGRSLAYVPGGKGANQAVAAARLGARVRMVARVGDDPFGEPVRANLEANGIDTARVTVAPGVPQGIAIITVDDAGQNSIVLASGSNGVLSPEDIDPAVFNGADVLLLQNEVSLEATARAALLAKAAGVRVLWNPAPAPDVLPEAMRGLVDVLLPNETEAGHLTGIPVVDEVSATSAAAAQRDRGTPAVAITLGEKGVLWQDASGTIRVPACPVEVVDTTAAGDTFAGALGVALAEGKPTEEALSFACAAAALAVTQLGAQSGIPTREKLEAFLKR